MMRKTKTDLINKLVHQNIMRYEINCQGNKTSWKTGKGSITNLLNPNYEQKKFLQTVKILKLEMP
jgi:hypothetical protein